MIFTHSHVRKFCLPTLIIFLIFVLQPNITAQSKQSRRTIKVLLLNVKSDGLSKEKAEEFFQKLQSKLSLYITLNVQQKDQLMSALGEEDQKALTACTQLSCIAEIATKAGIERIAVCTVTKKGAVYIVRSLEFDAITNAKRSQVDEQQSCKSPAELNEFQNRVAVVLGQKIAGVAYIPKGLQPSGTSWWWYAGAAATIGLGVGIYFLVSKSNESASPKSMTLPVPPDLP